MNNDNFKGISSTVVQNYCFMKNCYGKRIHSIYDTSLSSVPTFSLKGETVSGNL